VADDRFLRFGAQVNGWVLLDTVSIGFELWRQLNNFPPRYPDGPPEEMKEEGIPQ